MRRSFSWIAILIISALPSLNHTAAPGNSAFTGSRSCDRARLAENHRTFIHGSD